MKLTLICQGDSKLSYGKAYRDDRVYEKQKYLAYSYKDVRSYHHKIRNQEEPRPVSQDYGQKKYFREIYEDQYGKEFFIIYHSEQQKRAILRKIKNSPNYDITELKFQKGSFRAHSYKTTFIAKGYHLA